MTKAGCVRTAARRAGAAALALAGGLIALAASLPVAAQDNFQLQNNLQADLCANPAAACGPQLEARCLERLSAGSEALPASEPCETQMRRYSACLAQAATRCGATPAAATPQGYDGAPFDPERLAKAAQIVIAFDPPSGTPAEGERCGKDPVCAARRFHRYHAGRIVFEAVERDPATGAVSGWLPLPVIKSFFRKHSTLYTGLAAPTADGLTITGRIFGDAGFEDCVIRLRAQPGSPRLSGDLACRRMAPMAARATL